MVIFTLLNMVCGHLLMFCGINVIKSIDHFNDSILGLGIRGVKRYQEKKWSSGV